MAKVEVKTGSNGLGIGSAILIICLAAAAFLFYNKSRRAESLANELTGNVQALTKELVGFQVRLNDSTEVYVAKAHQLTIELSDWKQMYRNEAQTVKKLRNHLSEVQTVGAVASISADTVSVPVHRDSIHQLHLDYKSTWIDISATIPITGEATLTYAKRDSLLLVQTIERKRLLWGLIRFGEKNTYWQVTSLDPKTTITGLSVKRIIR